MIGQCSNQVLEAALAGSLPADDEAALQRHLDECETCGATLEHMAGGDSWRQEAAILLAADELDKALPVHDEWSEVDFTVEHLEPSDEPNVLGRLGGYDILEIIGRGGMGVVLKASDRELKRCVAIKVLAPHLAHSTLAKKRFAREAQAAAAVVHPHVLAIHQVQAGGRLPYFVMPLVAGESLAQRLKSQGPLELKEILRIGMQAASGLAAAHGQGLVHRDVKPANILLEMGVERAVLTDFGLARAADDVSMTRRGIIAGTPQYMSPEQAKGEPLDGRSDLFSLGCVMYEMATGVSPFRADSAMATMRRLVEESPQAMVSLNPALPPWFIDIVNKLLEKDASRRFGSAKEVSELLEVCLAHVQQPSVVALPATLAKPDPLPKSRRQKSRLIGVMTMLAVLGASVLGWALVSQQPPMYDISGQWVTKDGWGTIILKRVNETDEFTGLYYNEYSNEKAIGEIHLKFGKEGRFHGTWQEGNGSFGEISLRGYGGNEIRGAATTDPKSKIQKVSRLADFTWVRDTEALRKKAIAPPAKTDPPILKLVEKYGDELKRASIPERYLQIAGGGKAAKAPAELVWVFYEEPKPKVNHAITGLAFSPDGRWLTIYRANSARIWDMKTGEPTFALSGQDDKQFSTAAFSPDSKMIVTRSKEGNFSLWNPATGTFIRELRGPNPSTQMAFSQNSTLAACGPDGKIKLWNTDTGASLQLRGESWKDFDIRGLAVNPDGVLIKTIDSPDGALIATIDDDRVIRIFKATTGEVIKTMSVMGASKQIMFSGDGKTLLWRSDSRFFPHLLWDVPTWKLLASPPGSGPHPDLVMFGTPIGVALHPTRRMVASTWSDDGTLRLWEFVNGRDHLQTFRMEAAGQVPTKNVPQKMVAFTPDGRYLAVAQYDGSVSLLRVPNELPLAIYAEPNDPVPPKK